MKAEIEMKQMHEKIIDLEEENEQLVKRQIYLAQANKSLKSELQAREDICEALKRTNHDLKRTIQVQAKNRQSACALKDYAMYVKEGDSESSIIAQKQIQSRSNSELKTPQKVRKDDQFNKTSARRSTPQPSDSRI